MSIASEISRLTTLRNNIRTKLIALGLLASASADLEDCYDAINGITAKAAATYTPGTSDQTIAAGQLLSGAQTIEAVITSNLSASNIANGITVKIGTALDDDSVASVTGTYTGGGSAANGSLIDVTCSSNIDAVTATVNGNTYSAYILSGHAYIVIPYTDTTSAQTCVLKAYNSGSQVTSATLSMSAGVAYYTTTLSTSSVVYSSGTWTNTPTFVNEQFMEIYESSTYFNVRVFGSMDGANGYLYITPAISRSGYTKIEIDISYVNSSYHAWFGVSNSSTVHPTTWMELDSTGTMTYPIPSGMLASELYFWFMGDSKTTTGSVGYVRITRLEFV